MRRLSFVVLLALIASLVPTPHSAAYAATFRNVVAQVPTTPGTGSVRIWMNSDTAQGETAGIEYNVGSNYVKVLGTYDTSYPGANWRADIPGQSAGTFVRYQLFTRNQSNSDYGFTGFNWSYTTSGAQCAGTAVGDNNIFYSGLFHDSFSSSYRAPIGPVAAGSGTVTLRFRTCANDAQGVTLRVWNDRAKGETLYTMAPDGTATDANVGPAQFWKVDLPVGTTPTILYYTFRATDGTATGYYRDDNPKFLGGGFGQAEANKNTAEDNSYQLTVFSPSFFTPEWMQRAVIYQIFPDRFRDGDSANNPQAGRFTYGGTGASGAIVRSNGTAWNTTVCDPRSLQGAGFNCPGYYGDNFYGGDLKGITQKIEDGYFSSLGVTVLYLNPIFRAPSNHKYDTANFMEIDPDFGTLADFQAMVAAANNRGIRIMLDGVFNHTSSDSPYFDRYSRYNAAGQLTNPNGGANDGSGACEAVGSQYRSWFYFEGDPNTSISNPGGDGGTIVRCADASGNFTKSYEAWYGYSSLPKIRSNLPAVRNYFYGHADAVGPYWTRMGASGWRFDVGEDVDPGLRDPSNTYWEGFRTAVRSVTRDNKPVNDTVMLGEEWGDGSGWLLGDEWDSVMNYRFRSAVLSWLFTGCSGNGCSNSGTSNAKFQENDSNDSSSSGSIFYLSPSQFNARLRSIAEDYPANAFKAMMNLEGSHDTQRIRFLLKKVNNDNDGAAVQRMKEWWLFAFTYAGAPTLYYGDEVGLSHDGVWDNHPTDPKYQDDPYNRAPFPWNDTPGAYQADTANLQAFARQMASIRHSYRALQDGDVQHGLVIDDTNKLYGFARTNGSQTALVLLNRSGSNQSAAFNGLNAAPYSLANGTVLVDAISGASYTVGAANGGSVTVNVTPTWGAVLLEQAKIETPAAPAVSAAGSGADVALSWPMVTSDSAGGVEVITSYKIFRGTSAAGTPLATVANPSFGGNPSYIDAGAAMGGYSYVVQACNAAGKCSTSPAVAPTKQAATLSVSPASGTYGGSVTLQATLSAGNANLADRTVSFKLNGASIGTATTDGQGVATLNASLGSIGAGEYAGGVTASFAGDNAYNGASGSAALTVAKATATITLGGLSQTYNGSPRAATATTNPAGLSGVSITYDGATAAPTNAGSYAVVATLANANYQATPASGTLVVNKAATTVTLGGLSQVYDGSIKSATATTTPAGLNVSFAYTGTPQNAGSYPVTATVNDANYSGSASGSLVISKATATISLSGLTQTYDGTPLAVGVSTSPAGLSGLSVTYDGSATPPTNAGSYAVVASLSNPNYAAANATGTLTINQATATLSLSNLTQSYDGAGKAATVTTSPPDLAGVTMTYDGAATLPVNVGSYAVVASLSNPNYTAANATGTLTINAANQTISFGELADKTYGNAPFQVSATASSGLAVSFSASGNCTIAGATVTIIGAGSCTVTASQAGGGNYSAASPVDRTFSIAKAPATISLSGLSKTYTGQPQSATASTSPTGLEGVTITYNGSATAPTNAGSYAVVASLDNPNYSAADATGTLVIAKAPATISLGSLSATYDGSPKAATATTSPAGLGVITITYNGSATAPTNAGSYAVVASLSNPNYEAPNATGTLVINKALATITLAGLSHTYNGTQKAATATTNPSGLTVDITYSAPPINAGSYTVTATIDDANYQGSANGTLVIAKAGQTISFGALANKTYGDAAFGVSATTSSGLAVTFSASGNCSVASSTVTITGAGSCTITASQAGDNNYNPAASVARTFSIAKAAATVSLSELTATYNGQPQGATISTNPTGLSYSVTYNGSATAPTNAGSYAVVATINDANYTGSASDTLEIKKAASTTTVTCPSSASHTGSPVTPCSASVTGPGGLNQSLTVTYANNISAGIATASASYPGGDNHQPSSDTKTFTINSPSSFQFSGFFAPVSNTQVNVVKAGSAVPVKFSLGGDRGLSIFASGYPAVVSINCSTSQPTQPISDGQTVTAGNSSLSYDAASGQYIYVWKTDKEWAGGCRQLVLKFTDGTTKTATFSFTR